MCRDGRSAAEDADEEEEPSAVLDSVVNLREDIRRRMDAELEEAMAGDSGDDDDDDDAGNSLFGDFEGDDDEPEDEEAANEAEAEPADPASLQVGQAIAGHKRTSSAADGQQSGGIQAKRAKGSAEDSGEFSYENILKQFRGSKKPRARQIAADDEDESNIGIDDELATHDDPSDDDEGSDGNDDNDSDDGNLLGALLD
jgi:hypothetical protein